MIEELIKKLDSEYSGFDAIVVEGYDGVGKGTILNELSSYYNITPYRPDYNLWQQFDHRKIDRWKVSGFFWDIFSHFNNSSGSLSMLFDRGVISGAVYNNDMRIAENYKKLLRDMKVLHILVTCEKEDYFKFLRARNPLIKDSEMEKEYLNYVIITGRYLESLEYAGVDYICYSNKYEESVHTDVCSSCGHYNYGICRHPLINREVDANSARCAYSKDKEVQDIDSEMYSLQS